MNYISLRLAEIGPALRAVADDARATFAGLDDARLNQKPDATQWSIAQCFEHLIATNDMMVESATAALNGPPSSVWQRLPLWPRLCGRMMVSSQGPRKPSSAKFRTNARATPPSQVAPGVIQRFVDQHQALEGWTRSLDEDAIRQAVMISPFASVVTYSVLDGLRLMVAHDRRHFEQARLLSP